MSLLHMRNEQGNFQSLMNHFLQLCINHRFNFLTNFEFETCTWVCIVLDLHSECETSETEIIYELEKGLLIC